MIMGTAYRFIQELTAWYHGDGTLAKANDFLGAPHQWLYETLLSETLIGLDGRPVGIFSCQQVIDVVLLHVAMRKGFEPSKKTK